jgi:hypothetical protein
MAMVERLQTIPGVAATGAADMAPFGSMIRPILRSERIAPEVIS